MTFRETARDTTIDSTEMVPTALATEEERETPVIHDEEDLPPVS